MKKIEENLNELLDVFDGSGVPNNSWVKNKLEETLILVKTHTTPNEGRGEEYHCELYEFGRCESPCARQCKSCFLMESKR